MQKTALGAMLVNRQFIIALAIGGVAYPLSLYRDIAKLAKASSLGERSSDLHVRPLEPLLTLQHGTSCSVDACHRSVCSH